MKLTFRENCCCGAEIELTIKGLGIREIDTRGIVKLDDWRKRHDNCQPALRTRDVRPR